MIRVIALLAPFWLWGVEPPPDSYLHKVPSVPVKIATVGDVNAVCQGFFADPYDVFRACTVLYPTVCYVFLPIPTTEHPQGYVDALEVHEVQGHCNGLIHHYGHGWFTRDGQEVTQ